jgi:hypothetical protein
VVPSNEAMIASRSLRLLCLVAGLAWAVCGASPVGASRPFEPVFRPGGYPLQVAWSARVPEGHRGAFVLYREQGALRVTVATLPVHIGERTYRIVDSGNVDASASYEIVLRDADGTEVTLGRLVCHRNSACKAPPPPRAPTQVLEDTVRIVSMLTEDSTGSPVTAGESRLRPGFRSTAHPPPW